MRFAAVMLLLAGCDKIFTLTPPDPTVPPRTVKLTYDRVWLGSGGQVTREALDPETLYVQKLDGTEIPFTRTGLGTVEFTTDVAVYAVGAATKFGGTEVQFSGADVHIRERVLGRPTRTTPVTPNTRIDFDVVPVPNPGPMTNYYVHTIGLWAQGEVPQPTSEVDYSGFNSLSGPLGVLDPAQGDELFLLENGTFIDTSAVARQRDQLLGYLRRAPALVPGGSVAIAGSLIATTTSHCVRITAEPTEELDRIESVAASSFALPAADWTVSSIPHGDLDIGGTALLAQDSSTDKTTSYDVKFENPISAATIVSMGAQRLRFYTVPGAVDATTLAYEVRVYNPPIPAVAGPCADQLLSAGRVALVDSISVNGKTISRDDQVVPDGDLDVTWSTSNGDADMYSVYLIEMTNSPAMMTVPIARIGITTAATRARIRSDYLQPGHYYYLAVETHVGFPGAQAGDFATIAYPRGYSSGVSGVFLVE